jgi:hypothetical protein
LKFKDPIDSRMRSIYQNYIGKRFKGLLEIVDAKEMAEGSGGYGGYGGRGEMDGGGRGAEMAATGVDEDFLVEWLDQDKLRVKLAFATDKPTPLQIWVTQEDLWVYETLLNVIAKTNKARGATRPDNAAIRTIVSLEVGPGAALGMGMGSGHVFMPSGGAGAAVAGGEMMDGGRGAYSEMAPSPEMMDGGRGGYGEMDGGMMAGGDPAAIDAAMLANRYLGDDGAPIADGSGDLGKEFRQLPIRMELVIDQRYIPQLLLECANSPLPIEVKQLRINPDKSQAGFEGQGGMSGGYSSGGATVTIDDPAFALLQLKGVVFIYNQPTAEPAATAPASEELAVGQ